MHATLLILALLVLAASLGSWLFSQWLSASRRSSALAIALGGTGFVLLIAASALAVVTASVSWKSFLPRFDLPQPADQAPMKTAPAAIAGVAAGGAEHWPATHCLQPLHATATRPRRWFIDNDCDKIVATVLAWCDEAKATCAAGSPQAAPAWHYEPAGIVMTSAMAKPTARRMPEHDAPIGGTYALAEPDGARLRIRYLACYLSEPAAAMVMNDSVAADEFHRALLADECYARVSSASQAGARIGQPPAISLP